MKGRTPLHEIVLATGALRAVSSVGRDRRVGARPRRLLRRRGAAPDRKPARALAPRSPSGADETGSASRRTTPPSRRRSTSGPPRRSPSPARADKPVQVWIVKPHGFDPAKKYPLILNVHGGPQQQWADAFRGDWQVYPGAGYVVAFPNPHGSTGFGQDYTSAISGDWGGKVMADIEKVADALEKLPFVDSDRMGAMGWSWGGYATMWLEGHTTRFKALASMMGVYDLRAMYSATEELWFPEWDLKGAPVGEPGALREAHRPPNYVAELQDAVPRDHGREGLPRPVHAVARVLHGPAGARRAVAPHRLREGRATGRAGTRWPSTTRRTSTGSTAGSAASASPWKPEDLVSGR